MNTLIVYAHPEPKSFNGALKDLAISVLSEQGHKVKVSDLYAMNFKAVANQDDFSKLADPDFLKLQVEQGKAYNNGTLAPDIVAEIEKLFWADLVVLQFPMWWFSMPAILKGWVDRVFITGAIYGGTDSRGARIYNNGGLQGRKAMISVTLGGFAGMNSMSGINGDINQQLFPINHGVLYFAGMQVLPSFVAYAPAQVGQNGREQILDEYKQRLLSIQTTPPLSYRPLADYDHNFVLKSGD
ncbi:MAG: NAD(P)H-dependent oxidoreductase [Nostoc sp.]|uniref:NAD(P)H-dependent oxidoreductase n=1 Tax=Nostoc sp. TaxID=1180 RepID=UPI002FF6BBAD